MPPYTISIPPQSNYLKQYISEKHMKLSIFPRKISNVIVRVNEDFNSNSNANLKNGQKSKFNRVLSLDKNLFKTLN